MKWKGKVVFGAILIVLIFFVFYTVFVNQIINVPILSFNSRNTGDWINYFGNVLGAFISICVIAFTLRQNSILHEELKETQSKNHEELMKLQVSTLYYTENNAAITNLTNSIAELCSLLNVGHLTLWKDSVGMYTYKSVSDYNVYVKQLQTEHNTLNQAIDNLVFKIEVIILANFNSDYCLRFKQDLYSIIDTYKCAIYPFYYPKIEDVRGDEVDSDIPPEFDPAFVIVGYKLYFPKSIPIELKYDEKLNLFINNSKKYLVTLKNEQKVYSISGGFAAVNL